MVDFSKFEKKLGVKLKDKKLLKQAFVHRSYLNENPKLQLKHNERLEFLGDAVLELIVTEHLFKNYKAPEGELTNWRAALVNAKTLAEIARKLGFGDYLLLSQGEAKDTGKARQYILANTFEAFLGSLYLSGGLKRTEEFVKKYVIKALPRIIEKGLFRDAKSLFQEIAQDKVKITPTYNVLEERGPDHVKHFVVGVFLEDELVAKGEGSSKQEGEEAAAREGLKAKGW